MSLVSRDVTGHNLWLRDNDWCGRHAEQVTGLCEGLLIQAKIDARLFVPRRELIDVSALAWEVVVAMRPLCAQRHQRITLDTPQVTREISADRALMLQVLTSSMPTTEPT